MIIYCYLLMELDETIISAFFTTTSFYRLQMQEINQYCTGIGNQ